MKFLNLTTNKRFYYSGKGCLFNTNKENCLIYVDENDVDYTLGEENSVQFYPSGAKITQKKNHSIYITFFKNNGDTLFTVSKKELNEMENTIYDINAYACMSGVLVSTEYYGNKFKYEYYLYNGTCLTETDFDKLNKKVNKYEELVGMYYDTTTQKNPATHTNFIKSFLDREK